MTEKMEAFAELMRSAEAAASSFDGSKLSRASEELGQYVELLLQQPLAKQEFEQIRDQLAAWRDLCAFLQDTLHGALFRAAGGSSAQAYGPQTKVAGPNGLCPEMVVSTHLQPLLRRYA